MKKKFKKETYYETSNFRKEMKNQDNLKGHLKNISFRIPKAKTIYSTRNKNSLDDEKRERC